MPAIQFSAALWRILSKKDRKRLEKILDARKRYQKYILRLLRVTARTDEPAVRYLEYEFPGLGCGRGTDEFMLGPKLLAAQVIEKRKTSRDVTVPLESGFSG